MARSFLGYPHDTPATYRRSLDFARQEKLFLCAFNPLVPFPGTPLYRELETAGQMRFAKWWMDESFRFGQTPFEPQRMTAEQIEECCYQTRCEFYRPVSILQRGLDWRSKQLQRETPLTVHEPESSGGAAKFTSADGFPSVRAPKRLPDAMSAFSFRNRNALGR